MSVLLGSYYAVYVLFKRGNNKKTYNMSSFLAYGVVTDDEIWYTCHVQSLYISRTCWWLFCNSSVNPSSFKSFEAHLRLESN